MLIVDLEHMLKVFPPPTTVESCHQLHRVMARGLCTTASLRGSDFRGASWGEHLVLPLVHPRGDWLTSLHHPVLWSLASHGLEWFDWLGGSSVRGRVNCDSPPSGLSQWLYCLLIQGCSPTRSWLMEWWCHLGGTQCQHRWCLGLMPVVP